MPPKSRAFQRIARQTLWPALDEMGFTRTPASGVIAWAREQPPNWLVLWTQMDRWNYGDGPEGYRFNVEMQLDVAPRVGFAGPRARLYRMLTDGERLEHLRLYNQVVRKARVDPTLLASITKTEWYNRDLVPRDTPFGARQDPWFRYTDEEDVRNWLTFVSRVLPGAIARFSLAAPEGGFLTL